MTETELRSAYAAILAGARPADLESSTLDFKEEPTDRSGRRSRAEITAIAYRARNTDEDRPPNH